MPSIINTKSTFLITGPPNKPLCLRPIKNSSLKNDLIGLQKLRLGLRSFSLDLSSSLSSLAFTLTLDRSLSLSSLALDHLHLSSLCFDQLRLSLLFVFFSPFSLFSSLTLDPSSLLSFLLSLLFLIGIYHI